jgi:hypothetical protein
MCSPADEGDVDRSRRGLDRPLCVHSRRPHRETHLSQVGHVAHSGIDHQADAPPTHQGRGQQIAEHPIGRSRCGRHDQHVTGLDHLHRGMDHHVVARWAQHGDRRATDPGPVLYRPDLWAHEPGSPRSLVDCGHPGLAETTDQVFGRPLDVADDDRAGHDSSEAT